MSDLESEAEIKDLIQEKLAKSDKQTQDIPLSSYYHYEKKPKKIPWLVIFICSFLVIFFTVLFFCVYFIPRSEYLNAKNEHPELDFFDIPFSPVILHWLYYIFILVLLVSIPSVIYFDYSVACIMIVSTAACTVFSFILIVPILDNKESILRSAFDDSQFYSFFENNIREIVNQNPILSVYWQGRKSSGYQCYPRTKIIESNSSNTSTYLPQFADYGWVQLKMNIELTREMIDYAYNYSLIYRKYLPNSSFKGHAITWENQTKYTLRGYNTDVTLIKRKNLEGKLSPDVGRTMMAFFSGVGYIYRLCTIPIYTAQINKTNVVMNFEPINESDQFFEIISVTSC